MIGADWVILFVILASVVMAAASGFFQEAFAIGGLVFGYLLAAWRYHRVSDWLSNYLKSPWLCDIAAFLIIFLAVMILAGHCRQARTLDHEGSRAEFVRPFPGWSAGFAARVPGGGCGIGQHGGFHPHFAMAGGFGVGALFSGGRTGRDLGGSRQSYEDGFIRVWICCIIRRPRAARNPPPASDSPLNKSFERKRDTVRDQLEALVMQMYKSNILYSEAVREFKKRFILTVLEENIGWWGLPVFGFNESE